MPSAATFMKILPFASPLSAMSQWSASASSTVSHTGTPLRSRTETLNGSAPRRREVSTGTIISAAKST